MCAAPYINGVMVSLMYFRYIEFIPSCDTNTYGREKKSVVFRFLKKVEKEKKVPFFSLSVYSLFVVVGVVYVFFHRLRLLTTDSIFRKPIKREHPVKRDNRENPSQITYGMDTVEIPF